MKKPFSLPRLCSSRSHRSPKTNTTIRNAAFSNSCRSGVTTSFSREQHHRRLRVGRVVQQPPYQNRGISADRSGWLLDRLDPIVNGHPKKLFLMIGTNDLAAGVVARGGGRQHRETARPLRRGVALDKDLRTEHPPCERRGYQLRPRTTGKRAPRSSRPTTDRSALRRPQECALHRRYSALVDQKGMLDQRYTNDGLHLMGEGYLAWKGVIEKYVK